MHHIYIMAMTSALLATSSVWAQEDSAEKKSPCVAVPIFHCTEYLEGVNAIGHFGYNLQCSKDAGPDAELYINIGDDNQFSPGQSDRGQPKVFLPGEHVDEFEVEFSMAEVKAESAISWSVLGQSAIVDFSKMKDESLNCSR